VVRKNAPEKRLLTAAAELQSFCTGHGWRACLIGGLAAIRWGRPRTTRDVDVSLWTGLGEEAPFVDALLGEFAPRIPTARQFSLDNRVLLIKASNGAPVDVALAGGGFEERMLDRATSHIYARSVSLCTASAEDLLVMKAFADRPQDWSDIEGILTRQKARLNWQQIEHELAPLCELKEAPEILQRLQQLREKLERG
jgi:hypothetical protein